ncbi:hypothetical protein JXJ21_11045, partial [candidate division KSB1 bacterium]|nr:hypothetical protein [candidate division KSB1 bacterium]
MMKLFKSSRHKIAFMAVLLCLIACGNSNRTQSDAEEAVDYRWEVPADFCHSLNPDRPHKIEVIAGTYRPGIQPQGIGDRLKQ